MDFQTIILRLFDYWSERGCVIAQPTDVEVGAGTFNPHTFLRALGPEPWRVAYVEPSRRPTDGRYGENPFRLQHYYQFQVILKPPPEDPQGEYIESLRRLGVDVVEHDLRFVQDDWEQPTLGASGLGWEVWLDGMEVSQFTYFQQVGSIELDPICVEYTYGLERIAMFLQGKDSVFDLVWRAPFTYGDVHHEGEVQGTRFNRDEADVAMHQDLFRAYETEAKRLVGKGLYLPAYDFVMKASHAFNILDARGAIGVNERAAYIARIRGLARKVATTYVAQREEKGFPLLQKGV